MASPRSTQMGAKGSRQSLTADRARRTRRSAYDQESVGRRGYEVQNGINTKLLAEARSLNQATEGDSKSVRKIRVITASTLISWGVLPFYIPHFLFWILGFFGLSVEASPIPLLDIVLPGTEIFLMSYFVIAFIGLSSLVYAVWIYSLRQIKPFDGPRTLAFALAVTGYLSFFLNLFPWVIFYILVVIYTEKTKSDS